MTLSVTQKEDAKWEVDAYCYEGRENPVRSRLHEKSNQLVQFVLFGCVSNVYK